MKYKKGMAGIVAAAAATMPAVYEAVKSFEKLEKQHVVETLLEKSGINPNWPMAPDLVGLASAIELKEGDKFITLKDEKQADNKSVTFVRK